MQLYESRTIFTLNHTVKLSDKRRMPMNPHADLLALAGRARTDKERADVLKALFGRLHDEHDRANTAETDADMAQRRIARLEEEMERLQAEAERASTVIRETADRVAIVTAELDGVTGEYERQRAELRKSTEDVAAQSRRAEEAEAALASIERQRQNAALAVMELQAFLQQGEHKVKEIARRVA